MKIERRGVPWIERHMQGKVVRQVRIGDEQLAERDRVGFSANACSALSHRSSVNGSGECTATTNA
jgi:hypothetical protein